MEDEFYTQEEIAKKLKIHVRTVRVLIKNGKINAYRIGKQLRIRHNDFEDFIKDRKEK